MQIQAVAVPVMRVIREKRLPLLYGEVLEKRPTEDFQFWDRQSPDWLRSISGAHERGLTMKKANQEIGGPRARKVFSSRRLASYTTGKT